MGAGDANVHRMPYPFGEDAVLLLMSGQVNIEASKTNHVWDYMTIPFEFRPDRVEIASQTVAITNAITIDVADEESTPQVMVNDEALAAITAGAGAGSDIVVATIDDYGPFLADGALLFRYTSGVSDTSVGTRARLWVTPTYKG